jgi:hypothetical protein
MNGGGFDTADDRCTDGFGVKNAPEGGGKALKSANNSENVQVFTMMKVCGVAGQLVSSS